ncbi:MAG TPA: hypothetical protein DER23_03600, partial [Clostridiales bacterium]|nr:hypothetical protein [Clostridiales bacterium]
MYCTRCGRLRITGESFCNHCGFRYSVITKNEDAVAVFSAVFANESNSDPASEKNDDLLGSEAPTNEDTSEEFDLPAFVEEPSSSLPPPACETPPDGSDMPPIPEPEDELPPPGIDVVVTTGGWFGTLLVLCIPVVGILFAIAWACGLSKRKNRIHFARAFLILIGLLLLL